ncbi:MAG: Uma2 family endonuclease [Desulfococcaceae bacterium]
MDWQEVCEHPSLKDLPFKIELNEWGQVVMSPAKVYHSAYQAEITRRLPQNGRVLTECAIQTPKGVRVADVAWASPGRFAIIKGETSCSTAPEICVEILSETNTGGEMTEKRDLYFAAGAEEVWTCDPEGRVRFYIPGEERNRSPRFPEFPNQIDLNL